jgi:hypothetical protein
VDLEPATIPSFLTSPIRGMERGRKAIAGYHLANLAP